MIRVKLLALLSVSLIWSGVCAQNTPPIVDANFSRDSILIGDQFKLTVDIDKDVVQITEFPVFDKGKLGEKLEIVSESKIDTISNKDRRVILRKEYTLTGFDEGSYNLGKFPVLYVDKNVTDTVWSADSLLIQVHTFEIDTTKQTIFDLKGQLDTPLKFGEFSGYLIIGLLVAALLAVIIYFIVRKMRNKPLIVRRQSLEPPHVIAIKELEKLHAQKLWQSGKVKLYYTRLTDILREYIEERYAISAMEMTSDEIIAAFNNEELINSKLKAQISETLNTADFVKFAKYIPDPQQNDTLYNYIYYFVEETKQIVVKEQSAKDLEESVKLNPVETETETNNEQSSENENQR